MTTLAELGEIELIRRITAGLPQRDDLVTAAGDDCAVVSLDGAADLVLTSDPVISGIHFTAATPPHLVGRKALGRVLSDIAAMGAEPRWALVNLVAPKSIAAATVEEIYRGINALAVEFAMAVAGGDVASGNELELHIFGIGAVPHAQALLRSTAQDGDILFVTGELGGSLQGRHLTFTPRIKEGIFLRSLATAMIDISDGLASEAAHLAAASRLNAVINVAEIPVSKAAATMPDSQSPLQHALYDGEDFELLFTVPAQKAKEFMTAWQQTFSLPCTAIGTMSAGPGQLLLQDNGSPLPPSPATGYRHFA